MKFRLPNEEGQGAYEWAVALGEIALFYVIIPYYLSRFTGLPWWLWVGVVFILTMLFKKFR